MAFHFTLQSLLRIRVSYERLERLRLLTLTALANRLRQEIAAVCAESEEARRDLQGRMAAGTSGGELQFAVANDRTRAARKQALEESLSRVKSRHEKQWRVFEAARRKRQILENLRARRWEEYRREQSRCEQKQVDELYLLRRSANPPEGTLE